MAADARLTILLALRGRPLFTRRWLDYAQAVALPFKVFLADGSNDEDAAFVEGLLRDKARYSNLDIEYARYPFDAAYSDYYAKMADALSRTRTPFAAMADNDDFPVPRGLDRLTSFLEAHPDYAACGGRMAEVVVESSDRLYGGRVALSPGHPQRDLKEESAAARVKSLFAHYQTSYYDVHRTAFMKDCFASLNEAAPADVFLAELWTALLAAAAGPVKKLPDVFLVRQRNTPGTTADGEAKKGDCLDRMLLPTWSEDFSAFSDTIARAIVARDGGSFDEARAGVTRGYRRYASPSWAAALAEKAPARVGAASAALRSVYRTLKALAPVRALSSEAYGAENIAGVDAVRRFLTAKAG